MRISRLLTAASLAVPLLLVGGCAEEGPVVVGLLLPVGDVDAGREAFVALRCHTCHEVEDDAEMPEPVSANRGTVVGRFEAGQTREQIALSVVSPSHWIPPPRDSSLSHMGDFRDAMTVQQLLDVVTWLEDKNR